MRKVKSQWVVVGLSAVAVLGVGAGAINFNSDNDENTETNQKVEIPDERTANKTSISDTDGEIIENGQLDDAQEESMVIEIPADSAEAFTSNYPVGTIAGVLEAPTSPIPTTTATTSNQNSQTVGSLPTPESPVNTSPVGTETGTGTDNVEVFPDLEETVQPGGESIPGNTTVTDSKTEELPADDQEITEQVTTNTIDETVSVPFDTVYVEDESLLVGEEQVVQQGTMGIIVNTYTEVVRGEVRESYSLTHTEVVSSPLNQIVHIGVKELKQETKTISTSYETVYQSDTELEKGQTEAIQVGVMGESVETYNVTYVKGIKVAEELVGTEVVRAPVNQIIAEGTKNIPVVTTKEEEKTVVVPYTTTEVEDASLESGKTEVRQEGVNGERVISEKVTLTDGIETDREVISETDIVSAVNKVVAVGTKVAEQKTETETETENIVAYTTLKQEENSIPMGELQLVQPGLFGYDTVTYEVTYTNGVETGRVETGRVTTLPVDEIVRVGTQVTETKTETVEERIVAFTTVKQEDSSFPIGQTEVIQAGVDGYDTVTYEVTYTNGIETRRTEVSRTTTVPVNEIVRVGTQVITIEDIVVTAAGNSSVVLNGKNIQMLANILSKNATDKTVTWSVESKTGTASIDASGLLTANSTGTVLVKATANDGSGVFGTKAITIAKSVSITRYEGIVNGELVIPGVIDGSKIVNGCYGDFLIGDILGVDELGIVTSIGEDAFRAKQLTSVIIPDSVTNIGPGAFGDNQLTSAYIPAGVTTIGAGAFYKNKLSEITIPKGISIIEDYTFGKNELTSVSIPNNVTIIRDAAFGNNKLTQVTLSEGLEIIRTGAFGSSDGTNQITILDIPNSVTEIGSFAFENNKLSIINIGSEVKIWDNALGGWNNYFRDAYEADGANVYLGSQNGSWYVVNPIDLDMDNDADSFTDYEERFIYGTDPELPNTIVLSKEDSSLLFDYDYLSEAFYIGSLNRSNISEVALWFGNNVASDNGSKQMIYEGILFDFIKDLSEKSNEAVLFRDVLAATQIYLEEAHDTIEKISLIGATSSDADVAIGNLNKYVNELESLVADAKANNNSGLWRQLLETSELAKSAMDTFIDLKDWIDLEDNFTNLMSDKGQLPKQFSDILKSYGDNLIAMGMESVEKVETTVSDPSEFTMGLDSVLKLTEVTLESFVKMSGYNLLLNNKIDHKGILETIASNTEDTALKAAANVILNVLEEEVSVGINAIVDLIEEGSAYGVNLGVSKLINAIPTVGPMISFSMELANQVVDVSGIAESTTKLTGISAAAHILAEDLAGKLSGLETDKGYYANYSGDDVMERELNLLIYQLANIRVTAEKQFGEAIEKFPRVILDASGVSEQTMAYVQDLEENLEVKFNVFDKYL